MLSRIKKTDDTLRTTADDLEITDEIRQTADPSLITVFSPFSVQAEQFRLLKNNILFPEKGEPARSIMVTSTSPGEGKSFVASNLAISIARSIDEYVLLMDCDLRRPVQHQLFGTGMQDGLSDYLAEKRSLSSILAKTFLEKLTLMPGGNIPHNPSELLSSGLMRKLIAEVRERYNDRYIIIDTPPPYITSEVNALVRQVDGVVLVVKNGAAKKKDIQALINIYGRDKIIGVVFNFAAGRKGYTYEYPGYYTDQRKQ